MPYAHHIAIDGGAGTGKTTLSKKLALRLQTHAFLDAGALYRTVTHWALKRNIDLDDAAALGELAQELRIVLRPPLYLRINEQPLGEHLYTPRIDSAVPFVSQHPEVRAPIRRIQHIISARQPVIFSGRDIGSVVLPDADVKLYLFVDLEERVRRQMLKHAGLFDEDYLRITLAWRDEMDSTRSISPLCQPDDAARIIGNTLSSDDMLMQAMQIVKLGVS